MERHFDEELANLRKELLRMAAMAQDAIFNSVEALKNRDKGRAQAVIDTDDKIDMLELEVDEKCIDLIARHQPMAGDLRFITTGMKINSELERIADLAVDISQRDQRNSDCQSDAGGNPEKVFLFRGRFGQIPFYLFQFFKDQIIENKQQWRERKIYQ